MQPENFKTSPSLNKEKQDEKLSLLMKTNVSSAKLSTTYLIRISHQQTFFISILYILILFILPRLAIAQIPPFIDVTKAKVFLNKYRPCHISWGLVYKKGKDESKTHANTMWGESVFCLADIEANSGTVYEGSGCAVTSYNLLTGQYVESMTHVYPLTATYPFHDYHYHFRENHRCTPKLAEEILLDKKSFYYRLSGVSLADGIAAFRYSYVANNIGDVTLLYSEPSYRWLYNKYVVDNSKRVSKKIKAEEQLQEKKRLQDIKDEEISRKNLNKQLEVERNKFKDEMERITNENK